MIATDSQTNLNKSDMTKREKLTKAETQSLREFVGECVLSNVVFPPTQMGGSSITIQELLHNRAVDSLGKYADFLEQQGGKLSRIDKINGVQEKKISGSSVTFTQAIEMIDLIIKNKMYDEYRASVEKKVIEIKKELEKMETPKERKAKLEKELAKLQA